MLNHANNIKFNRFLAKLKKFASHTVRTLGFVRPNLFHSTIDFICINNGTQQVIISLSHRRLNQILHHNGDILKM